MLTNFQDVQEFHRKFGFTGPDRPELDPPKIASLDFDAAIAFLRAAERTIMDGRKPDDKTAGRLQMMIEEIREISEAVAANDLPAVADGLVDLAYFVFGTADIMGIPWQAVWDEVQAANMRKVRVTSAEESRRLNKLDVKKPQGWTPPDVKAIIEKAQYRSWCDRCALPFEADALADDQEFCLCPRREEDL